MSDESDSLMLHYLRRLDEGQKELKADMLELKERLGSPDDQSGGLIGQYASLSRRLDRVAGDVEQIKKRLGIAEA